VSGLPAGLTGAPISSQRGKLPPPVIGRIVGRFGQTLDTGLTRKGMKLQTTPGAQVVAPFEGRVVYAGKFRGYGELLIIEHGEGYHSLLSGLARIDSTMGQWVVSGEPVGVMGRSNRRKPVLYIELRRNGQPINPLPWLSAKR
jgi:septal ring factor EnvC (AmiA/AmiB activator)